MIVRNGFAATAVLACTAKQPAPAAPPRSPPFALHGHGARAAISPLKKKLGANAEFMVGLDGAPLIDTFRDSAVRPGTRPVPAPKAP